ncbi:Tetratricopeptide repeat (TPR)-like superfamily protein [Euphorbia peplus]|nr:Tetratricopeptide repeat (TPR)-like superfamily protein [Euphorbia peplus]
MSKLKPQSSSLLNSCEEFPFLFSVTSIREKISELESQSQDSPTQSTLNNLILSLRTQISLFMNKPYKHLNQIKQLHAPLTTSGMLPYPWISNTLLYKYLYFSALPDARLLFDRMPVKNFISWRTMISWYLKDGNFTQSLISFREMIDSGVQPDDTTLIPVIKACRGSTGFQMGRLVHCIALRNALDCDYVVSEKLVDMYVRYGMIDDATKLFDRMSVARTMMIQKYAEFGNVDVVLSFYARMRDKRFSPDDAVMKAVTKGTMNKASLVQKGPLSFNVKSKSRKRLERRYRQKHRLRQKHAAKADNNLAIQPLKEMVDDLSGSAAGNKASLD